MRFRVIIVIVMLVSATMAAAFYWHYSTYEVEEPLSSTDTLMINDDELWKGRDEVMERPLVVKNGATLRIRDSHLRVLLEDLFLWDSTWFTVEEGCSLVFERSTLEVVVDELLEDAVYLGHPSTLVWDPDGSIPYISRVVNLVDSADPVLSFNVAWRGEIPRLMVVGQEMIGSDLQLLATFRYEGTDYGEWTHHEVDLKGLGDHVARVAIAPMRTKMDAMLISNVTITDGDHMPPHDFFPTGDPFDDWWYSGGPGEFLSFKDEMRSYTLWPALIEAEAEVRFENSRVTAPSGMSRWIKALVGQEQLRLPENATLSNIDVVSRGCQIEIDGGHLAVVGTDVEHVPIVANSSTIEMLSSNVTGDANDVTLDHCSGSLEAVAFRAVAPRGWRPFSYGHKFEGQYLWSLSMEGDREGTGFTVARCTFEGAEVAVVAKDVDVHMTDCQLSNVQMVGIWDNRADWEGGWTSTHEQLRFEEIGGLRYLMTSEKSLVYDGPNRPTENQGGNYDGSLELLDDVDRSWPDIGLALGDWGRGILYMPTMVIERNGNTRYIDNVQVYVTANWGGRGREVTVQASDTIVEVWLDRDEEPTPYQGPGLFYAMSTGIGASNVTGNVVLGLDLWNRTLSREGFYKDLMVKVTVDGVPFDTYDAMEDIAREDYDLHREFEIPLTPGLTEINATLYGSNNTTTEPVIIHYREWTVLRHTEGSDPVLLGEAISGSADKVMIDPWVMVELTNVRPSYFITGDYIVSGLDLFLSEGSSLFLSSTEFDQPDFLNVDIRGNGSLHLEGFSTGLLTLNCDGAEVTFKDCIIDHSITTFYAMDCDLLIEDCTITLPGWGPWTSLNDIRVVIRNTTFRNDGAARYEWHLGDNASLEMRDCTFVNVTLGSSPDLRCHHNVSLDVQDCTFMGDCAFLALTNPYFKDYGWHPDTFVDGTFNVNISGNTFIGPNAGVVGFPEQIRALGDGNLFLDGATILAQFKACATVERRYRYYDNVPTFMDGARGLDKTFMGRDYDEMEDPLTLMDVTDDPSIPIEPTQVWVMVRGGGEGEGPVDGFFLVPITDITTVLEPPTWNHLDNLFPQFLQNLRGELEENGNFWEP